MTSRRSAAPLIKGTDGGKDVLGALKGVLQTARVNWLRTRRLDG
ncbi:hypothetical protein [Streptomyces sp. NPDC058385]